MDEAKRIAAVSISPIRERLAEPGMIDYGATLIQRGLESLVQRSILASASIVADDGYNANPTNISNFAVRYVGPVGVLTPIGVIYVDLNVSVERA